ncbi:MAG TPA: hypothetical protein VMJ66_00715 [Geobacteraceae bacterium]|nr:hypothetical protein [Geobacteraceae bacterium]
MKGKDRCRSKVGIVDKSLANLYHVHSDLIKSNATLKDRAAINMAAWTGDIFDAGKRCRK